MIGFYDENTNTFNGGNHTPYDWRTGLVSGEVHFDGPNARAVYGNAVPLTNNNYTHYGNVNAPPGGNPLAGLMNGVAFYRGTRYEISALDLAVMADLGMGTVRDDVFDQTWLDVIRGGAGLDTFIGDYSARTTPMSIDAASGVVALPGLQLHEIEKLVLNLGTAADTFVGSDGEDVIRSGAGNDFLQGRGGNDTLIGDDGNDWLDGGAGADAIDGGQSGTDVAAYGASPAAVTMYLEFSSYSGGDADGDTLFHIANLSGSAFGDNLFGHAGGNLLWGQGGNDNIYGQGGSDQLFGGDGDDRLDGGAQYRFAKRRLHRRRGRGRHVHRHRRCFGLALRRQSLRKRRRKPPARQSRQRLHSRPRGRRHDRRRRR
jgi:Ca2+-binding RTX toxin-like protein